MSSAEASTPVLFGRDICKSFRRDGGEIVQALELLLVAAHRHFARVEPREVEHVRDEVRHLAGLGLDRARERRLRKAAR